MIAHAVRLGRRYARSVRDVEALLAQREIVLSYETIRRPVTQFGADDAEVLRRRAWAGGVSGALSGYPQSGR